MTQQPGQDPEDLAQDQDAGEASQPTGAAAGDGPSVDGADSRAGDTDQDAEPASEPDA